MEALQEAIAIAEQERDAALALNQTANTARTAAEAQVAQALLDLAAAQATTATANAALLAAAATAAGNVTFALSQKYFHADSNLNRNSKAIYGEMYFALSDDTNFTLGGRYTEFEINDFAFNSLLIFKI